MVSMQFVETFTPQTEGNCVVTNTKFRFVTETKVYISTWKTSPRCHSETNKPNFHSPGVVFQNKGKINHERHAGSFSNNTEV